MCNTNMIESDVDVNKIRDQKTELEEETRKLKEIQMLAGKMMAYKPVVRKAFPLPLTAEMKVEADANSVHVGNVDYSVTEEELKKHFHGCGSVTRVTIPLDKFRKTPKGFAYVEFTDKEGKELGLKMNGSLLKGRAIKVVEKRTNVRGISTTNRQPYGGNGRGQGGVVVKYVYVNGYKARGARYHASRGPY